MTSETLAEIVAEMRELADDIESGNAVVGQTVWRNYADRIEAAWRRERAEVEAEIQERSSEEALVMNCATCSHFQRKRLYCPVKDTLNTTPNILPIFREGSCDKWKCKFSRKGGFKWR